MRLAIRTLSLALCIALTACSFGNILPQTQPVLSSLNGALTPIGPVGSVVVLTGAGFGETQGAGRVNFIPQSTGGIGITPTVLSWTQAAITIIAPTADPGDYSVSVVNGNSSISSSQRTFTLTAAQPFTPSAVTWTAGPALPQAISGAAATYARIGSSHFVYVVGGAAAGGAPVNTVYYAPVGTDGTLGAWTATTPLPTALSFPAAVAATQWNSEVLTFGYLYVLGGSTSAGGAPVTTIYRAPIANTGILGNWMSITALPAPLRSLGAAVQYGSMYVIGGATTGNNPVVTTYRLPVQVSGNLNGPWKAQGSLPAGRARFGMGVLGLYLYVVGGDASATVPDDAATTGMQNTVYVAKLNPSTRDIATPWAATTGLGNARAANTAVFASGNALVIGGLYTGASTHTSESEYAAINEDGTAGAFATAAPATSLNALCSCNLFNQATTGYVAGNGTYHVLVAGGDDVNAPGTRRAETFTF